MAGYSGSRDVAEKQALLTPNFSVDDNDLITPMGILPLQITMGHNGKLNKFQFLINKVDHLNDISIRMTNCMYEDDFKTLEADMTRWYAQCNTFSLRMKDVHTNGFFGAEIVLPESESSVWARVQVTGIVGSTVRNIRVAALDYGIIDQVNLYQMSTLERQYRHRVPQLGLKAELKLYPSRRNIPIEKMTEVMKKKLPGKRVQIYTGFYRHASVEEQFSKVAGVFFMANGMTVQEFIEQYC